MKKLPEDLRDREVNLHTHTCLCKHASGTVADYCRAALDSGLAVLGMSDHSPFPDDRRPTPRMRFDQMPEYLAMISDARREFSDLTILAGLEIDVDRDFPREFYRDGLLKRFDLDFLAVGVHFAQTQDGEDRYVNPQRRFDLETIRLFAEKNVAMIEWGIFDFIAHPDVCAMSLDRWTPEIEEILRAIPAAAARTGVPLEINAYGLRKPEGDYADGQRHQYPLEAFWRMAAEYPITCVIGSDAHRPQDVYGNSDEAYALAEKYRIPCVNAELARKIIARKHA